MIFRDRQDAGIRLAEALTKYRDENVVVFALPRGGVALGAEIAKKLHAPLDLIIVRKIGHPLNPEYAICAIAEEGTPVCNETEISKLDPRWLADAVTKERNEIRQRRKKYLGNTEISSVDGKTAIIVDDGIATGLTMLAAIEEIRRRNAKRIVVAIPVTPVDTARRLQFVADELVSLKIDEAFLGAVGAYYQDFHQMQDSEVIVLLKSVCGQIEA